MATYSERLTVTWWLWPATLAGTALLAAQLGIGAIPLRHPLTFIIACTAAAAGLLVLGRIRVSVVGREFRVDDARLPLDVVGSIEALGPAERRDLLGPEADPLAFVIQRPWIPGGVRLDLDDPTDPTPYWFVSSRRPEQLAAALHQARDGARASRGDSE